MLSRAYAPVCEILHIYLFSYCPSVIISLQKKAVASGGGGAAGGDTDDLQARLDQLRRGDDD